MRLCGGGLSVFAAWGQFFECDWVFLVVGRVLCGLSGDFEVCGSWICCGESGLVDDEIKSP